MKKKGIGALIACFTIVISVRASAENPISMSWMKMGGGWSGFVYISDAVVEIFYKKPGMKEFRSTGFHDDLIDRDTGRKLANRSISYPFTLNPVKFLIKYTDLAGNEQGPFEYVMDPKNENVKNAKSFLKFTKNSWISYHDREYDRKTVVCFSSLLMEGISEIHYGIDRETPDTKYDFQPFDDPDHYPDHSKTFTVVPDETEFVTVQVTFGDGVKSDVLRFDNPSPGRPEEVFPFEDYAPILSSIPAHCFISGVAGSE